MKIKRLYNTYSNTVYLIPTIQVSYWRDRGFSIVVIWLNKGFEVMSRWGVE